MGYVVGLVCVFVFVGVSGGGGGGCGGGGGEGFSQELDTVRQLAHDCD